MQHGGSCGVTPTILLASITLIIANLLRWAAALWIAQLKRKNEKKRKSNGREGQWPKWMRRSTVVKRYTLGKIVRPTAIDRFSSRLAVTRCVYLFESSAWKRRQENHSADRSAVDQSSVKDAVTWRTIFSTYVFNTKISLRLTILLYEIVLNASRQKVPNYSQHFLDSTVERWPKEHPYICAFCIIKSARLIVPQRICVDSL